MSEYVAWYDQELTAVVADEHYTQELQTLRVGEERGARRIRELRSEVAWLRLPALADAIAVRDVLQVDGGSVSTGGRLRGLLESPGIDLESRVGAILDAGAAHNLAPGSRNINFPTFPLVFARRSNLNRSRWRIVRQAGPNLVLDFRERQRPTVVRSARGAHLRGQGRFFLEPTSGRIERTELRVQGVEAPIGGRGDNPTLSYESTTTYMEDAGIGFWVPATMIDFLARGEGTLVDHVAGTARYTNYRRFRTGARIVPHP